MNELEILEDSVTVLEDETVTVHQTNESTRFVIKRYGELCFEILVQDFTVLLFNYQYIISNSPTVLYFPNIMFAVEFVFQNLFLEKLRLKLKTYEQ